MYDFDDVPLSQKYKRRLANKFNSVKKINSTPKKGRRSGCIHAGGIKKEGRPSIEYFRDLAEQHIRDYQKARLIY